MRTLRGLLLAVALVAGANPALALEPEQGETFWSVGGSWGKTFVPNAAEWRDGELWVVSQKDQERHAETAARTADKLRHDERFVSRFGKVVTKVTVHNGTWLEQGDRFGVSLGELSKREAKVAREEMDAALELASELGTTVTDDVDLFRFHHDGKIKSWLALPPRPRGDKAGFTLVRPIGEGANSRAYEVRSASGDFRVIKVLKPWAPRRFPSVAPPSMLQKLANEAEYLSETLQRDDEFRERFGQIIPKTRAIAPGVIAQELAKGVKFDDLSESKQEKARKEIKALVKIADRLVPGVVITARTKNYLYGEDGSLRGAYDLASDGHKAYNKVGKSERTFAHLRGK